MITQTTGFTMKPIKDRRKAQIPLGDVKRIQFTGIMYGLIIAGVFFILIAVIKMYYS